MVKRLPYTYHQKPLHLQIIWDGSWIVVWQSPQWHRGTTLSPPPPSPFSSSSSSLSSLLVAHPNTSSSASSSFLSLPKSLLSNQQKKKSYPLGTVPSSYLYRLINRAKQFCQKKMKFLKLQWQQNEDYNESEDYVLEECFCDALGPTSTHLAVCGREEKVYHLGLAFTPKS